MSSNAHAGLTPLSYAHHFGPNRHADHWIYRCFDADGRLLYIGCTLDPKKRMAAHRRGGTAKASRWLKATMERAEVEGPFRGRDAGRDAEAAAIRAEHPLFNYQQTSDINHAAWMTRRPIALYLVDRGLIELAVETVCTCWPEFTERGEFMDDCAAHAAAFVAGLTDLRPEVRGGSA